MARAHSSRHRNCACRMWTSASLTGSVLVTGSAVPMDATKSARLLQSGEVEWVNSARAA